MTPEDLKAYKKKEAFRVKALRNKKFSTQHSNKEKAKAILKVTKNHQTYIRINRASAKL